MEVYQRHGRAESKISCNFTRTPTLLRHSAFKRTEAYADSSGQRASVHAHDHVMYTHGRA